MTLWWLLPAAVVLSAVLTGLLRRYAIANQVIDVPNDRSLHAAPTPRGGGVAIVLTFLGGLGLLAWRGLVEGQVAIALVGSSLMVSTIGFVDDHRPVAARWRLLVHVASACWALAWLGGLPAIDVFGRTIESNWVGHAAAALGLVWLLNLYNFMDGIDGIAAAEAVTAAGGIAVIIMLDSPTQPDWMLAALLATAASGFLFWNWPPAKIFLGDAGSGFLGLILGLLTVHFARLGGHLLWACVILLGAFVVDATVTLVRRVQRGEKSYEAHRSHAYPHEAGRYGAHKPVTLAVCAINLFWLLPLALLASTGRIDSLTALAIAYAPLVWLAFRYDAGQPFQHSPVAARLPGSH